MPDGGKRVGRVGDAEVLLVRPGAEILAVDAHCTHHHGPLADGPVVDGARTLATMMTLAAIALIIPAAFQIAAETTPEGLGRLSVSISVVLISVYGAYLFFALVAHPGLFSGAREAEEEAAAVSVWRATAILVTATVGIAAMSEIMVGAIEPTAKEFGLSKAFVGVFLVAIVGNAAEHATAISAAMKNRMDMSLSIAIGSSVQVALFVAPVLMLASLFVGPTPMDPAFPAGLVLIVLLSVLIAGQVAGDGRSDWLKGAQLLAVDLVLALSFFFLPSSPSSH